MVGIRDATEPVDEEEKQVVEHELTHYGIDLVRFLCFPDDFPVLFVHL
jgi:hypothetical protein